MTAHPFLSIPENAKAYQTLCDCPSGSIRSWAAKAGWTRSRMERFLLQLRAAGLATLDVGLKGSTFVPKGGVPDASRTETRPAADLGSKSESDKVPRYGEAEVELIRAANVVLAERAWDLIPENNRGSLAGAKKILQIVPFDRAKPLLEAAVRLFNPSATGGGALRSLGHPFITRYVINEHRRVERDLDRGQMPIVFMDRVAGRPVYGARKFEALPAKVEPVDWRAIATGKEKPQRMA